METAELKTIGQEGDGPTGEEADMLLDQDRAQRAAELSGPTAMRGYEPPMDSHVAFVVAQYDGMDHMGGG